MWSHDLTSINVIASRKNYNKESADPFCRHYWNVYHRGIDLNACIDLTVVHGEHQ